MNSQKITKVTRGALKGKACFAPPASSVILQVSIIAPRYESHRCACKTYSHHGKINHFKIKYHDVTQKLMGSC